MNVSRSMRKLCTALTASLDLEAPVDPQTLFRALCDAMSRTRGGRPIVLRFERFPHRADHLGTVAEHGGVRHRRRGEVHDP